MFVVVRFHSPSAGAQELAPAANRPGLRHVAFKVDDVRGVVDRVREAGWETVGEIGRTRRRPGVIRTGRARILGRRASLSCRDATALERVNLGPWSGALPCES
jgi:catechol 2,3-dioxygenase-like lactoylglutathione lyase family enzyme